MANNYTQFSTEFVPYTLEQEAFIVGALKAAEEATVGQWLDAHALEVDNADYFLSGVTYALVDGALCIYSTDDGVLDHVVDLVAEAQQRFDDPRPWSAEAAFTCSKPRVGEFGGYAVFVHKGNARWLSTRQWLDEQLKGDPNG